MNVFNVYLIVSDTYFYKYIYEYLYKVHCAKGMTLFPMKKPLQRNTNFKTPSKVIKSSCLVYIEFKSEQHTAVNLMQNQTVSIRVECLSPPDHTFTIAARLKGF